MSAAVVTAAACLAAAAVAVLPPRGAVPGGAAVLGGTGLLALLGAASVLPAVCAFLFAAVVRALLVDRRRSRQLLAEMAAGRAAEAEAAVLAERTRIAREVHDVLGHSLTALLLQLQVARAALDRPGDLRAEVEQGIARGIALARQGMRDLGTAVETLRGDVPDVARLRALVDDFAAATGIRCRLDAPERLPLGPEQLLTVYRTVQESLANVARHAAPDLVLVHLGTADGAVVLRVADHSSGTAAGAVSGTVPEVPPLARGGSGYGLTGLRERASLAGGTLTASSAADGFRVTLRLPVTPVQVGDRS